MPLCLGCSRDVIEQELAALRCPECLPRYQQLQEQDRRLSAPEEQPQDQRERWRRRVDTAVLRLHRRGLPTGASAPELDRILAEDRQRKQEERRQREQDERRRRQQERARQRHRQQQQRQSWKGVHAELAAARSDQRDPAERELRQVAQEAAGVHAGRESAPRREKGSANVFLGGLPGSGRGRGRRR